MAYFLNSKLHTFVHHSFFVQTIPINHTMIMMTPLIRQSMESSSSIRRHRTKNHTDIRSVLLLLLAFGSIVPVVAWTSCHHPYHPINNNPHFRRCPRNSQYNLQQQSHTHDRRSSLLWSGTINTDDIPSLYKEQETLLVKRGEYEGRLMANTGTPLETHTIKGAGTKGGFGGGSSTGKNKKPSASLLKTQAKAHSKLLYQDGVIRLDNVLSPETAAELRAWLYHYRADSENLVKSGACPPKARFADVLLQENRCDMPVPLGSESSNHIIAQALYEVLCLSPIGAILQQTLGNDATLYELSSLMSDPGSQRQVVHPDTPMMENRQKNQPTMYTCFIALQDITPDMGPTTWLPGTHTEEVHAIFQQDTVVDSSHSDDTDNPPLSPKDHLLHTRPSKLGILPTGACGLYDSRLLHCGGANQSTDQNNSRALFYMSFKCPQIGYPGNPASIRPEVAGEWTLQALVHECTQFGKGKANRLVVKEE